MSKKDYSKLEDPTYHSSVNEPIAVYGLSINDLRTELIREVLQLEDKSLLSEALDYLKKLTSHPAINQIATPAGKQEWWDQISAEERQAIDAGLADIESGRTISHDEMRKRYEQWL